MATSRHSFQFEGHKFEFDLDERMSLNEYLWQANVWCDGRGIGDIRGTISRTTVAPHEWAQGYLKAKAVVEVEKRVRTRDRIDW